MSPVVHSRDDDRSSGFCHTPRGSRFVHRLESNVTMLKSEAGTENGNGYGQQVTAELVVTIVDRTVDELVVGVSFLDPRPTFESSGALGGIAESDQSRAAPTSVTLRCTGCAPTAARLASASRRRSTPRVLPRARADLGPALRAE